MNYGPIARQSLRIAGAALALTMAVTAAPPPVAAADTVAPTATVIYLPTGKLLTAFSKNAQGGTGQAYVQTKICHGQLTQEMSNLYLRVKVWPGPCDEGFSRAVLNGYLIAYSNVTRRTADLRGYFDGRWRLIRPDGFVLAEGVWSGTVGVGTHRPVGTSPCEDCKEPEHYEGRLDGRVLVPGDYYNAEIRATLAGTGPLQPLTAQRISLEGVVVSKCINVTTPHYDLPILGRLIPSLDDYLKQIELPDLRMPAVD